ncbi:MAG TPA: response regulator [Blastocatellia bacterium]|nr:response regulator [Blastocatellia bacterium]
MASNLGREKGSAKGRILFIDDDDDTCEMVKVVLNQAGYEVNAGRSVAEGLLLVRKKKFDLILMDWYFSDGTGIELCRAVRQSDARTPIFFYTGMSQEQQIQAALEAGAQGCFIKPVEIETLLNTIAAQIDTRPPNND